MILTTLDTGSAVRQNLMITNDMGNPLYSDFPSGHLQCLTLLGLQQYIGMGLFGLNLKFVRGGENRVLIEKVLPDGRAYVTRAPQVPRALVR